jgi:cell shape-determining protein MreD
MDWVTTGLALGAVTFGMMLYTVSLFRNHTTLDSSRFGALVILWSGMITGVLIVLLCLSFGPTHMAWATQEDLESIRTIAIIFITSSFSKLREHLKKTVRGNLDLPDHPYQERVSA